MRFHSLQLQSTLLATFALLLNLAACGSGNQTSTLANAQGAETLVSEPWNFVPAVESRQLQLTIDHIRTQQNKPSRLCIVNYAEVSAQRPPADALLMPCQTLKPGESSKTFTLKNLPFPSYLFVFLDENNNGQLDFANFNAIVASSTTAREGYAFIEDPRCAVQPSTACHALFLARGENSLTSSLRYEADPFWKLAQDQLWEVFYSYARSH